MVRVHRTASFMVQVLKISLLGHRKRIIASLAERPYEEPPVKPPRLSQIRVRTFLLPFPFTLEIGCALMRWNPPVCLSSAMTCLFPSPRLPSVRWSPAQGALWTPCCLSENLGERKSQTQTLRFPINTKVNGTDHACVSPQYFFICQGGRTLLYVAQVWIICLFFRSGMRRSLENPVWPWGHLVWQHPTPWSRTGIINLRSSSLNLALMKPVYVLILHHPEWRNLHSPTNAQTKMSPVLLQYLGSMLIKDLRGTESTQDACAKMRVCVAICFLTSVIFTPN